MYINFHKLFSSTSTDAPECFDERFRPFNDSCYLVVSFPEVEWMLAQKICNSMGSQLASIATFEENRFIK